MTRATLIRTATGDQGTFGALMSADGAFECVTGELPWRDNAKGSSCIPHGTYVFRWRTDSPKHGACYEMDPDDEAPSRINVQVHAANWMGDSAKGYKCQLLGCIAPGLDRGELEGQQAVLASKKALTLLEEHFKREPFELTIAWAAGVGPG